ncbi:MAG: 4Fe-4S dicluster domain-containing protein, partial [Bifidobacteriaceae bacterium]|nr:4Fe-4S dicluster domain-containing protein [Bifidobacteriaceae bacterium]
GAGPLLERICPAHVYTVQPDGSVGALWAACLECGTCLALAPPGVLTWHYPSGGMGIVYRQG